MNLVRIGYRLALIYFVLVAVIGCVMRAFPLLDTMPFEFRNLIHSHSHTAMLGWVFNVLMLGIVNEFCASSFRDKRWVKFFFWGLQASIIGMFVLFIYQGYAFWSILFSTMNVLFTYAFIFMILRELRTNSKNSNLLKLFLKTSLLFLFLSTFGPWALGVLGAKGLAGTPVYKSAIYWFLHFTYNGWMTMALLTLWLKTIEKLDLISSPKRLKQGLYLLLISIPGSFLLSLLEFEMPWFWGVFAAVFGLIQLLGFFSIGNGIKWLQFKSTNQIDSFVKNILVMGLFVLIGKSVLQVLSAWPGLNLLVFFNRDVIVFYLHLVLVGWVSFTCLAFLIHQCVDVISVKVKIGCWFLGIGLVVQEVLLGLNSLIKLNEILVRTGLFWAAVFMFIGVLMLAVFMPVFGIKSKSLV